MKQLLLLALAALGQIIPKLLVLAVISLIVWMVWELFVGPVFGLKPLSAPEAFGAALGLVLIRLALLPSSGGGSYEG